MHKRRGPKRQYSDSDKATALVTLDANGGNVARTARLLRIPHKTLDDWVKGRNQHADVAMLTDYKRGDLTEELEEIAHQCADLLPEKLPNASVREIVGALHIVIEKLQLLRSQPTSITATPADLQRISEKLAIAIENAQHRSLKSEN